MNLKYSGPVFPNKLGPDDGNEWKILAVLIFALLMIYVFSILVKL
jgi:hypothetical protein